MVELHDLIASVSTALEKVFTDEKSLGRGGERTHTWASGYRPCLRAMALDLLHPEDAEFDSQSYARMAFGDVYEVAARTRLEQAGLVSDPRFTIEAQQERFKIKGSQGSGAAAGQVVLTGKIDGKLRFDGHGGAVPFEIKAGESVKRVRSVEDLLASTWASRYLYQLLAYLYGNGAPVGIFVFHSGGLPTLIPVALEDHLDRMESFLASAEAAYRAKKGAPLPVHTSNPEHCLRCDHRDKSCAPPWFATEGPFVSDSEELKTVVKDVERHADAAKQHKRAKDRLSTICRGKRLVLIGDRTITGRPWGKGWRTEVQP